MMKRLARIFLFSFFALWLTPNLIGGFKIADGLETYVIGGAVLAFIYLFIKPILQLFFLPINLLSLGFLSWLVNVALLYLLTIIVPQVQIFAWQFPGISYQGFVVPPYFLSQIATFILVSFILSLIINFLDWLSR
ncbi:phage holin family protein [Candidatus Gottesmanbacteria bacterium]|nr:phage holin family protein [Candidatus Gottesmanbacteria bacterium]